MRWVVSSVTRSAVAAVAIALGMGAADARASTTVGQLFAPNTNCTADQTRLQVGVPDGNSYAVSADGVITSWSFQDGSGAVDPAAGLKLKVARPAGTDTYTIIGESDGGSQTAGAVNTRQVRIPVKAGDVIGIYYQSGGCEQGGLSASDRYDRLAGDQAVNSTSAYTADSHGRIPVQATVEPDADGDGFGDETQDHCVGQPGANDGCPDQPPPPEVHPTATLVQCDYLVATSTDTCTAAVADAAGANLSTPTGQMTFASDRGVFLVGQNCNLQPSAFAGIASCSVQYAPANLHDFPSVSASYPGDSHHSSSSGATKFEVPGSVAGLSEPKASPGQFPNEVDLTLDVPPGGVSLLACASSTSATTATGARAFDLGSLVIDPNADPATVVAKLQGFLALFKAAAPTIASALSSPPSATTTGQLSKLDTQVNGLISAIGAAGDKLLAQAQDLQNAGNSTEAQQLLQQRAQLIEQANGLISNILQAEDRACKGTINGSKSGRVVASGLAKRKTKRHLVVLGTVVRRGLKAGEFRIHLRLNRKRLNRLAGRRKKITVAIRIFTKLPSATFSSGLPVATVQRITLKRAPRKKHH
jgi:hypothetical protein